jgi:formate dehydrogenase major subunit
MGQLSRRDFMKLGAAGTGVAGVTALGFDLSEAVAVKRELRIEGAKEVHSLCPYCAVGCSLVAYTKQDAKGHTRLLQIEGDPDSPVNEGRLCPKGATSMQLAVSTRRVEKPLYRATTCSTGSRSASRSRATPPS